MDFQQILLYNIQFNDQEQHIQVLNQNKKIINFELQNIKNHQVNQGYLIIRLDDQQVIRQLDMLQQLIIRQIKKQSGNFKEKYYKFQNLIRQNKFQDNYLHIQILKTSIYDDISGEEVILQSKKDKCKYIQEQQHLQNVCIFINKMIISGQFIQLDLQAYRINTSSQSKLTDTIQKIKDLNMDKGMVMNGGNVQPRHNIQIDLINGSLIDEISTIQQQPIQPQTQYSQEYVYFDQDDEQYEYETQEAKTQNINDTYNTKSLKQLKQEEMSRQRQLNSNMISEEIQKTESLIIQKPRNNKTTEEIPKERKKQKSKSKIKSKSKDNKQKQQKVPKVKQIQFF